jgi:hypothetical protein
VQGLLDGRKYRSSAEAEQGSGEESQIGVARFARMVRIAKDAAVRGRLPGGQPHQRGR